MSAPFIETFASAKLPWAVTGAVHTFPELPPLERHESLMQEFATWSR